MCPARLSPDSSYFRTPNISTHRHSWVRETANIMPHRIGSAERLNARMCKVSMESTPTCGVQMCDSGMAAHLQASERPRRPPCGTPKRRRRFGFLLRSWNQREEFDTGPRCYCPRSSILINHALWRLRSVLITTFTFSASSLVNRKLTGRACSQTPHRAWRRL